MRFLVKRARDGQWYWVLQARNGRVLATSETYTRRSAAERAAWATWKALRSGGPVCITVGSRKPGVKS